MERFPVRDAATGRLVDPVGVETAAIGIEGPVRNHDDQRQRFRHLDSVDVVEPDVGSVAGAGKRIEHRRSEEHTSELQSLMRISYAVFCLKNTITTKSTIHLHIHKM